MAITNDERRFLRSWEEQRTGGKSSYIATYTFGWFIVLFMMGVALGLFSGLRLVNARIILVWSLISAVGAVALSWWMWQRNQRRFRSIIKRVIAGQGEPDDRLA
jgi:hypothetical protein